VDDIGSSNEQEKKKKINTGLVERPQVSTTKDIDTEIER
jgi:hypothetical protein